MRSFLKANRIGFIVLLTLCMVMSFAVAASADAAVLTTPTVGALTDGYYACTVPVSGITTGGDATILIYSGDTPTEDTIVYANQETTSDGAYTFHPDLPKGAYTVKVGGTGVTSTTGTIAPNTAPAISGDAAATVAENATVGTVVKTYTVSDADSDAVTVSISGGTMQSSFTIVKDGETYKLQVNAALDYETVSSGTVIISANDGLAVTNKTVDITVSDVSYGAASYTLTGGNTAAIAANESVPTLPSSVAIVDDAEGDAHNASVTLAWDAEPAVSGGLVTPGTYTASGTVAAFDEFVEAIDVEYELTVSAISIAADGYTNPGDVEAATGTAFADLTLPATVTTTSYGGVSVSWAGEYDADTAGDYVLSATSTSPYFTFAVAPTVTVTLADPDVVVESLVGATATGYTGDAWNELTGVPATVTGNLAGGGTHDFAVTWNYDGVYEDSVAGEQVITGTLTPEAGYDISGVTPQITVTLAQATIEIVSITAPDAITNKYVGTAWADLGAPAKVIGLDAEDNEYELDVEWDDDAYDNMSTSAHNFAGTVDFGELYTDVTEGTVQLSVTLKKYTITDASLDLGTIYVGEDDDYEDVMPTTVVAASATDYVGTRDITITWPESIAPWPPQGEHLDVNAESITDDDYFTAGNKTFHVRFVVVDKNLGIRVNGYASNSVAKAGAPISVVANYYDNTATYAYALTDVAVEPDYADYEYSASNTHTFNDVTIAGESKKVTVFVKVNDELVASRSVTLLFAKSLYYGYAYVDATESNPTYSALRVNTKADGMTVTTDIRSYNGDVVDYPAYAVIKDYNTGEALITKELQDGSVFISKDEMSGLTAKAYKVAVALMDDETVVYSTIDRTFYYVDHLVSLASSRTDGRIGTIRVNKNRELLHEFTLDSLSPDGEWYAGAQIIASNAKLNNAELTDLTEGAVYRTSFDISEYANGAYNLVSAVKRSDNQNYFDFKQVKTIYIQNSVVALATPYFNGQMITNLTGTTEGLTVRVHWAAGALQVNDNIEYRYSIHEYDSTASRKCGETILINDQPYVSSTTKDAVTVTEGTLADALGLGRKVLKIEAYINGVLDTTQTCQFTVD